MECELVGDIADGMTVVVLDEASGIVVPLLTSSAITRLIYIRDPVDRTKFRFLRREVSHKFDTAE